MKYGWWGIGEDFQPDVKNAGHEAFGIQPAAETLPDEMIQSGLDADLQQFIGFCLGKLLVNGDKNGHREVVAGLIVTNQHFDHRADGYPPEFYRGASVQSFERTIEVKYFFDSRV